MSLSRKNEDGQAVVLMAISLTVLMGMAALVLDVGLWMRSDRRLQQTADAAALAGAQMLPADPAGAKSLALSYANQNGGDVLGSDIVVSTTYTSNDTISVDAAKNEPGFFSKVFGIGSARVEASAKARTDSPQTARYVAPMTVYCDHPLIQNCNGDHTPTFNVNTTLDFDKMGAPGAFGMLNLDGGNGTPGASEEGDWILHGFDKYLGLGKYRSDPGAKFSSSNVNGALDARVGSVLLFPVFKTLDGTGQNAEYDIIGWIGFYLTSVDVHGNSATLHGYFTEYIAQGILAASGSGIPNTFGVKSVQLIG
ncbi:MAG: pilus assembly protein TadG-related protein [Gaiellaceae bacterium]